MKKARGKEAAADGHGRQSGRWGQRAELCALKNARGKAATADGRGRQSGRWGI